ncbi:MAG: SDR family NAD(P)-dependent oxidoreductase [Deltaproteobacteria bacterium]|nr:SDR family NAD(P)-dependent oxidoreductase [Deltaproteobacteria bacterium]MBW2445802.1 SDR family NAD(P)-dependent oxidoreductase [Deltaproteobacteria bacterium]
MKALEGRIAVVTGASRGIGKGIALELGAAGATVYLTGRTVVEGSAEFPGTIGGTAQEVEELGGKAVAVQCDHGDDDQIIALFDRVRKEQGRLDILVNNVFTAPKQRILQGGGFWEYPISIWDEILHVGCRGHYVASHEAVPLMIEQKEGLIVNISSFAGAAYAFNLAYGVGKAAVDRMARDMAYELRDHNVTCVSLWPGWVRTEHILQRAADGELPFSVENGESPRFTGRAVVAVATDPDRMARSGQVLVVNELGREYGFTDVDGRQPGSLPEQMGLSTPGSEGS